MKNVFSFLKSKFFLGVEFGDWAFYLVLPIVWVINLVYLFVRLFYDDFYYGFSSLGPWMWLSDDTVISLMISAYIVAFGAPFVFLAMVGCIYKYTRYRRKPSRRIR